MSSKVLYTSYFARHSTHSKAVAITAKKPIWAKRMMFCQALAPSWKLVKSYKTGSIDETEYKRRYLQELIDRKLTPQQVADTLPDGAVLLCYEQTGKFCHRHIAAEWLMNGTDVHITELS